MNKQANVVKKAKAIAKKFGYDYDTATSLIQDAAYNNALKEGMGFECDTLAKFEMEISGDHYLRVYGAGVDVDGFRDAIGDCLNAEQAETHLREKMNKNSKRAWLASTDWKAEVNAAQADHQDLLNTQADLI